MNVADLLDILKEYPLSLRLVLKAKGQSPGLETTIAETMCNLMKLPRDESLTIFGLSSCIIRECCDTKRDPVRHWVELDAR